MNTYIGIDIGTSSAKFMLVSEDGSIINTVRKTYPISYPQSGWSEQDPNDWLNKTIVGIKKLLKNQKVNTLSTIGFAGQMHGLVILDKEDNVIRPAILWNDGRTQKESDNLNLKKTILVDNVSNISFAGFTASKLIWLKENEPQNFKKINKIMLPKDYVIYKLTGAHSTDISDASGTLLYDVSNQKWNDYMLNECSINKNLLPTIYSANDIVGNVKDKYLKELGLNHNVKVIAGAADNAAAAIGNGVVNKGECNLSLGTSGTLFLVIDKHIKKIHEAVHNFGYLKDKYHLLSCILSAASCNQWWIENILETNNYQKELSGLEEKLGNNNIYYLPYLMGERSPHNDSDAKSLFIGMTPNTTKKDMTLAILEGVAFALRDSLESIKETGFIINKTRISGGGAKVKVWQTILASVLNLELEILEFDDGAAYGAAILAISGNTNEKIETILKKVIKIKETIYPNQSLVLKYENKYQKYKLLYPALKDVFKKI